MMIHDDCIILLMIIFDIFPGMCKEEVEAMQVNMQHCKEILLCQTVPVSS